MILFICTANICRSPMAQELFNALAEDRGLPFRAKSAGTAALEGRPMAENGLVALEEVGIYPGRHHARRVSAAMVDDAELVLAMTPQHAATVRRLSGDPPRGIRTMASFTVSSRPSIKDLSIFKSSTGRSFTQCSAE